MGICKFCEIEVCETWYGNWCEKCRRLKHIINLFTLREEDEKCEVD